MKSEMPKSSASLVARFGDLVPADPRVQRKQMFGYPCAVVGGNMFMSLHGERLILRLPKEQIDELLKRDDCSLFEPMPGRPMKGFVAVTPDRIDDSILRSWVESALQQGLSMPVKERASRKPRAKRS